MDDFRFVVTEFEATDEAIELWQWRSEHDDGLAQVALGVGYESESSFSKAVKRQYQKTPGQFRKEKHERIAKAALQAERDAETSLIE